MTTPASITSLLPSVGNTNFDTPEFRTVIEDFLVLLRNAQSTKIVPVEPNVYYTWRFDWFGLLTEMKVPRHVFWTTIRMNGGMSYTDVPSELAILLIPDVKFLENLAQVQLSKKRS